MRKLISSYSPTVLQSYLKVFIALTGFLSGLIMVVPAQSYLSDVVSVQIVDANSLPTGGSPGNLTFNDPFLDSLFALYQVDSFVQKFPRAMEFDHPNAEPLSRYYYIHCDCDEGLLNNAIIHNASGFYNNSSLVGIPTNLTEPCTDQPAEYVYPNLAWAQWYLDITNAPAAWNITCGSPDVKIAIVEIGGFDHNHEDLLGNVQSIHGTMFGGPGDDRVHGTAAAGCAAAVTNNVYPSGHLKAGQPIGVASIGYNSGLMLYGHKGNYNGIMEAALDGADIINCSWFWECNNIIQDHADILEMVIDMGVVVVAGAGNGNANNFQNSCNSNGHGQVFPASFPEVISVSSVDKHKQFTASTGDFHTHNSAVDVVAPGFFHLKLIPGNNADHNGQGTSFASPITAGLVALILDVDPCLSPQDIETILKQTSQDVSNISNNASFYTGTVPGLIDAGAAVSLAQTFRGSVDMTAATGASTMGDTRLNGDLIIPSGAKVTLTGTLKMPVDGSVIIQQGGKLIVDGGTITVTNSNCKDGLWKGIEVWGSQFYAHPSQNDINNDLHPNHGALILQNGANIKHARNAIRNYQVGASLYNSGGIIQTRNSRFENNHRSVELLEFKPRKYNAGVTSNLNRSFFIDCTFALNDMVRFDEMTVNASITMWAVEGIKLHGNTFINETPGVFSEPLGAGIATIDAIYTVEPRCLAWSSGNCAVYDTPNRFENLRTGMYIGTTQMLPGVTEVHHNEFIETIDGMIVQGVDHNASITYNHFEIPSAVGALVVRKGIYFDGATGFEVAENTFEETGTKAAETAGIYLTHSGKDENILYKNYFENLSNGVITQKDNQALQFKCNEFSQPMFFTNIQNTSTSPSLPTQGECLVGNPNFTDLERSMALPGNVFSHESPNAQNCNGVFDMHIGNNTPAIEYNHHTYSGPLPLNPYKPECRVAVSPAQCQIEIQEGSCPSKVSSQSTDPGIIIGTLALIDQNIANTSDENALVYLKRERDHTLRLLTWSYFRLDSLFEGTDAALLNFLRTDTTYLAKKMLIPLLIHEEIYDEANTLLAAFPQDDAEDSAFVALHQILKDVHSSDRYFGEMTEAEEATIRQIETTETVSAAKARVILQQAYGEEFPLYYDDINLSRLANREEVKSDHFLCYPNPVSHTLHLQASPEHDWQMMEVQIVDLSGRLLFEESWRNKVSTDRIQKRIDVSGWQEGIYWVLWKVDAKILSSRSLAILH